MSADNPQTPPGGRRPSDPASGPFRPKTFNWIIILGLFLLLGYQLFMMRTAKEADVPYTEFKAAVREDRVIEVRIAQDVIAGVQAPKGKSRENLPEKEKVVFRTVRVSDEDLYRDLEAHQVQVHGVVESDWGSGLLTFGLILAPFIFLLFMSRRLRDAQGGFMTVGKSKAKVAVETDVKTTFNDVAGVDEAKDELREVIDFLKNPGRYTKLGGKIPKGILLVGPPGTGKTLLAKAVAGEAGVPFFFISGSEFVEMFVGVGAARVRDLFEQARKKAPCIIFLDELDALGKARGIGPMAHEEREQTLNQLLVELDGFDARIGVILMAATNRPEILDPALLRAGRFDRHVLVDRPDKVGRLAILQIHARKVPLENEKDLDEIAAMTPGFSGAELANIINESALLAVRRDKDKVGKSELLEAVERTIAGLEKKNRTLKKSERETVAHHEVGHALVALHIPGMDAVRKISIIPRGIAALGYTLQVPTEDRFLMTKRELEDKIAVLLGGRVAEELIFKEVSTGAKDDLQKATDIARSMIKAYGMSDKLGWVSLERDGTPAFLQMPGGGERGDYSEETAREIDCEIRRMIDEQYARTRGILAGQEAALRQAAKVLLEKETISGEDLLVIVKSVDGHGDPPVVRA
ncbi:MAG: ATP-dependent zinc metalloprotease FtsH [Deltaproteobacteria bacterium]|nr:ATP-dependent zinc metalloprotease FtsH [Deltaproteobacteria bacterium]